MATDGSAAPPARVPGEWAPTVQTLVRSLDEARYFRGSLVVVHGPPGVGKTRLIDAALEAACVSRRRIRRTFLEARDVESPYKAVLSLAHWAARLEEIAPALDSGSLVLAPFLRALSSDPTSSAEAPSPSPGDSRKAPQGSDYQRLITDLEFYKRGVEAWGERSRFLHEVGWMILDAAARRHLVWIVESAQNLDPHSLSVLRYLAGCLEENPLVVWLNVDTPPDDRLPPGLAPLAEGPRASRVAVPRLSLDGVREVLGWRHPGQTFPDRVVEGLLKESQGLILTVEQLATDPHLLPAPGSARAAPPSALALVLRQLDALPRPARELLEQLAVVSEEVSVQSALRLTGRSEPEVRRDLETLAETGLLLEQEPDHYCFRLTDLPGEVETRLSEARFHELHRVAAETLERSPSPFADRIFALADHWRKAEVWDRAARASLSAARFASDLFAPEGGLLHAQRALDAARRASGGPAGLDAEALVEKGRALYDLGRLHEALAALRDALPLIGETPDAWPSRARALFYLARALSSLARPKEADEVVQEATHALAHVDDARVRLMLHQVIGVAFMMTNQNREAVGHFRSMLALAEGLGDPREVSYAQKNLSAVLLALDPHDAEGWRLVDAALEHHARTNNFAGLAAGHLNRGLARIDLHEPEAALLDLGRAREAAELAHAPLLIATASLEEAKMLLDRFAVERADRLLKQLGPWMPTMEEPWARISFALLTARVAEAQGRPEDAERLYEEAACMAEPGGESPALWEVRLRQAALARRVGSLERFRRLRDALPPSGEIAKLAPTLVSLREQLEAPAS